MEGFIKLHRQIIENEFWLSERFSKSQAWIDLLLLATFKQRTFFIRGVEICLKPGELCYSQKTLSERWRWNERTVNKYLKALKIRKMIQSRINNVTTIITILNWKTYQVDTVQTTDQNTKQSKTKIQTNKNVKNVKKSKVKNFSIEFLPEDLNGELFYKNKYFFVPQILKKELLEKFDSKNLTEGALKIEFYKMEEWLERNEPKTDYKRFFINWLSNMKIQPNNNTNQTTNGITLRSA